MRQIIITADDLGADAARNDGIFDAIRAGIVTSVSILANGPASKKSLKTLRSLAHNPISFGFHMNLSEGKPLASNLRLLVGEDGNFLKKTTARAVLMQPGDPELEGEIDHELVSQMETFLDGGLRITHLDGHQHVHVFPAVLPVTLKIAQRYKIPWVRIPEEPSPSAGLEDIPPWLSEEAKFFSGLAHAARLKLTGDKIQTPDHFRGLYLKGRFSLPVLFDLLQQVPPGLTELMVHPGQTSQTPLASPFSAFSTADRLRELKTLLDPAFLKALKRSHIHLISFPVASC
jgi:chitin disaccharide deacetylase